MYKLFYDELSEQFFIADDVDVASKLNFLSERLRKKNGSFTYFDYLNLLGIQGKVSKQKNKRFSRKNIDYPFVFETLPALRSGPGKLGKSIEVMSITILVSNDDLYELLKASHG